MGKDPVKCCIIFKKYGYAHVDGYLCDYETCDIRLNINKRNYLKR